MLGASRGKRPLGFLDDARRRLDVRAAPRVRVREGPLAEEVGRVAEAHGAALEIGLVQSCLDVLHIETCVATTGELGYHGDNVASMA